MPLVVNRGENLCATADGGDITFSCGGRTGGKEKEGDYFNHFGVDHRSGEEIGGKIEGGGGGRGRREAMKIALKAGIWSHAMAMGERKGGRTPYFLLIGEMKPGPARIKGNVRNPGGETDEACGIVAVINNSDRQLWAGANVVPFVVYG